MSAKTITRAIMAIAALGTLLIISLGLIQPKAPEAPGTAGSQGKNIPVVGLAKGNAAPNFTVKTLSGRMVSLSDFRGKVVMLNFWEINCVGCQTEMPGIQKVYARMQAQHRDCVMLGINLTDAEQQVRQFAQVKGVTYPLGVDAGPTIGQLYALRGTPTTYFLDRQGIIREWSEGAVEEDTIQQILQKLLV